MLFDVKSVVEALKEEGILHDNHTILPKYFDVRGIHIITDRGKEIYFRLPLSFFIKDDGADVIIKNIIEYRIGRDIEITDSIKDIIIILDCKIYHKCFETSKGMYVKVIFIEKGAKYSSRLYREDFKYKKTSIRKI